MKAVKEGDTGFGLRFDEKPNEVYNHRVQVQIGIFKKLKTSKKEVKDSKYILERDIFRLLDETEFKKKNSSDFEALYLNAGLKKCELLLMKSFYQ